MSRWIIHVIVAIVIAALTVTAYLVTTSQQADEVNGDLEALVGRSRQQLEQSAALDGLTHLNLANNLAANKRLATALEAIRQDAPSKDDYDLLKDHAEYAIKEFLGGDDHKDRAARLSAMDIALVDVDGDVVFLNDRSVIPTAGQYKDGDGKIVIPSLDWVLPAGASPRRVSACELGRMPDVGLSWIAVAPVVDGTDQILGAVVLAAPVTADGVRDQDKLLGVRVAYFDAAGVAATSFLRGKEENTEMHRRIEHVLVSHKLRDHAFDERQDPIGPLVQVQIDGTSYLAATVRLPRFATRKVGPAIAAGEYRPQQVGAIVMIAGGDEASRFTAPARTFILLLGAGALVIALLGMYLAQHRLETQIDEIELGVAEVINGNLDRTFRPVGAELDGLANGLNVMLSRLLGRPEPGEEAFDEHGNPIIPGKVDFEDADDGAPDADAELAALAQEAEPDYYRRLYNEYVSARRDVGSPDDVTFESFIAKLRVNEGKLRAQYECRAVRFRVVVKDGKVSLKPVPIF
jgi:HAMP domain-containing protein